MHLETSRIERPAEPPDHAALARSVPSLEHDDGAVRCLEIGLLHALEHFLQVAKPAFVVGELQFREALNASKARAFGDNEVGGLHPRRRSLDRVLWKNLSCFSALAKLRKTSG